MCRAYSVCITCVLDAGGDKEAVNVSLLMPLVHKAELSWTEIQVLIDVLLNKQQGSVDSAEWIEVKSSLATSYCWLTVTLPGSSGWKL